MKTKLPYVLKGHARATNPGLNNHEFAVYEHQDRSGFSECLECNESWKFGVAKPSEDEIIIDYFDLRTDAQKVIAKLLKIL